MAHNLEHYFLDVISNREPGFQAGCLRKLLFVLSKVYGGIVQLRLFFYACGVFRKKTLGCLIISIGNITVGGTGKTPLVEMFARALTEGGRKVAVLSRGYKRKRKYAVWDIFKTGRWDEPPEVVSDGERIVMNSEDAGDEPYMLAKNLTGIAVVVGRNRVKSGSYAIEKFAADTLVLDDGFQYLPLDRRLNIVLVDATNPFGNGHLLPRGTLREPLRNLARADLFFITKAKDIPTGPIKERIREHNSTAEIVECYYEPRYLVNIVTGEKADLSYLEGKRAAVMTAIADPEGFEASIGRLGARVVAVSRYADHYRFSERDLDAVVASVEKKGDCIVTTEKDFVRLPPGRKYAMPIFYLRVEVKIISGARDFSDCVARLCNF
jgi:tetraacyldisaccharide 4'-kinase